MRPSRAGTKWGRWVRLKGVPKRVGLLTEQPSGWHAEPETMRDRLFQRRGLVLAAVSGTVAIIVAASAFVLLSQSRSAPQAPPQAAASAPLPTLIAVEATAAATDETNTTTTPQATPAASADTSPFA